MHVLHILEAQAWRPQVQQGPMGWMLAAAIAAFVLLSAPTLAALGVPYDVPYGSFPAKIHPGTYVLLIALLGATVALDAPGLRLLQRCREQPLLAGYLLCMVLCFAWAVGRHGPSGLAFYIDTLIVPGVACLLLAGQRPAMRQGILSMIMLLVGLNAALAVVEYFFKFHLVPGIMGTLDGESDGFFRSAALLGHPLTNASVTVTALPFVLYLPWHALWRWALGLLMVLALLSFGGRTSLALGLLVYGPVALWALGREVARGRWTYLQLTGGGVGLLLMLAALVGVVLATGLGDRIFSNLAWDNSANGRLVAWQTLAHFSGLDWWLGIPIDRIDHLAERVGLDLRYEAIENFWIYQLLLLGMVGFVPFVAGLLMLVVHLLWRAPAAARLAVLVYVVVASGTNSLASKTISLLVLATLVHTTTQHPRTNMPQVSA
jgi:hypothetical protein